MRLRIALHRMIFLNAGDDDQRFGCSAHGMTAIIARRNIYDNQARRHFAGDGRILLTDVREYGFVSCDE